MNLVTTDWLESNLDKVKVFDNIARVKDWFLNEVEFDAELEAAAEEMGDVCWHYQNGDLVRNEEGEVIHTDEEFSAYVARHPEKFAPPQEECEDCTGWPEGVE